MTARLLIEEDQKGNANPLALVSRAPRLTLTQAFGIIHRIKVDGERGMGTRKGIGTALISSQVPFWEQMGVQSLVVQTHDMSEGFYERLGFQRTGPLAEFRNNAGILTNMRLDLNDFMQNACFQSAIQRHPASVLKNG